MAKRVKLNVDDYYNQDDDYGGYGDEYYQEDEVEQAIKESKKLKKQTAKQKKCKWPS